VKGESDVNITAVKPSKLQGTNWKSAGAVLPGSSGPEHQWASTVPQPTDNPYCGSCHLVEVRGGKLDGSDDRTNKDIFDHALFQHPRDLTPIDHQYLVCGLPTNR